MIKFTLSRAFGILTTVIPAFVIECIIVLQIINSEIILIRLFYILTFIGIVLGVLSYCLFWAFIFYVQDKYPGLQEKLTGTTNQVNIAFTKRFVLIFVPIPSEYAKDKVLLKLQNRAKKMTIITFLFVGFVITPLFFIASKIYGRF